MKHGGEECQDCHRENEPKDNLRFHYVFRFITTIEPSQDECKRECETGWLVTPRILGRQVQRRDAMNLKPRSRSRIWRSFWTAAALCRFHIAWDFPAGMR